MWKPLSTTREHWERVFSTTASNEVSWFQPQLTQSLEMIAACGLSPDDPIIDVGGGASSLAGSLLDAGYRDITVLDIAGSALDAARQGLGERAQRIDWQHHDITKFTPTRQWVLWHDRAVFHFLTDASERAAYRQALRLGLGAQGHVVLATFGPSGPKRCSGLRVVRYSPDELARELGPNFALSGSRIEQHSTPSGKTQEFVYAHLQRVPDTGG